MQPRVLLTLLAANIRFWFMVGLLAGQSRDCPLESCSSSSLTPRLCWCVELFFLRFRIPYFPLLNVVEFPLTHFFQPVNVPLNGTQ